MRRCKIIGCNKKHLAKDLCIRHYNNIIYKKTPNGIKVRHEQNKRYRERNRDRLRERSRTFRRTDKGKAYSTKASKKRRDRIRQATPKWADKASIINYIKNCPLGFQVDHIIPIAGKIICGLHVLENLQYLPESGNKRKGVRLEQNY